MWNLACFSWVAAPVISFWPGSSPQVAQMVWWMLASIMVIACSSFKRIEREAEGVPLFVLGSFIVFFMHGLILYQKDSFSFGTAWLMKVAVISSAAILISQRETWERLFNVLQLCLLFQIPILIIQKMNIANAWGIANGTTGTRAGLGILAAYVTINSSGVRSWFSAGLATLSTSMTGMIPALANRAWSIKKARWVLVAVGLAALFIVPMEARASSRFEVWSSLSFLKNGWLTGWGFLPISGTFRLDALGGAALASLRFTDYHSTFFDWIARFGLVGVLAISPFIHWVVKRTITDPISWKTWSLILASFACAVQSAEGILVMVLLGLMWIMRLNEEAIHVD